MTDKITCKWTFGYKSDPGDIFTEKSRYSVEEANRAITVSSASTETRLLAREAGSMKPDNQYYPCLRLIPTYLDSGVNLLILIFGLVVRHVFLLWRLHPGGEETMSPPNKGSLSPQARLSRPTNTRQILGGFSCFPWVHSSVLNKRFFKEEHSSVASLTSASSAPPAPELQLKPRGRSLMSGNAPFHYVWKRNNNINNNTSTLFLLIKSDKLNLWLLPRFVQYFLSQI